MSKLPEVTVTVLGVEVTVEYEADKGYPGSREEPPEPAYVDVITIKIGGEDITDIVTEQFKDALQTEVEEVLSEKDYDPA